MYTYVYRLPYAYIILPRDFSLVRSFCREKNRNPGRVRMQACTAYAHYSKDISTQQTHQHRASAHADGATPKTHVDGRSAPARAPPLQT